LNCSRIWKIAFFPRPEVGPWLSGVDGTSGLP